MGSETKGASSLANHDDASLPEGVKPAEVVFRVNRNLSGDDDYGPSSHKAGTGVASAPSPGDVKMLRSKGFWRRLLGKKKEGVCINK
ncbi:hypothetical protein Taro_020140 [Colocasia esculenta]|uniref:Uncharacterized protein n=1 Tax=Colocasia esculenta TaxID=4460 RepID=A0A843UYT4_COLES|nr:hypothetical protein [Colocasia esculenta]